MKALPGTKNGFCLCSKQNPWTLGVTDYFYYQPDPEADVSLPHSFPELAGALLGTGSVAAGDAAAAAGFTGAAGVLEAGAGDAVGAAEGAEAFVVFSGATGDFSGATGLAAGAGSALGAPCALAEAGPLVVADAACDEAVGAGVAAADEDGVDVDQDEEAAGVAALS
jgi:hypothetical protein